MYSYDTHIASINYENMIWIFVNGNIVATSLPRHGPAIRIVARECWPAAFLLFSGS